MYMGSWVNFYFTGVHLWFISIRISHVSVFFNPPLRKLQKELPAVFHQSEQWSDHFSLNAHIRDFLFSCHLVLEKNMFDFCYLLHLVSQHAYQCPSPMSWNEKYMLLVYLYILCVIYCIYCIYELHLKLKTLTLHSKVFTNLEFS